MSPPRPGRVSPTICGTGGDRPASAAASWGTWPGCWPISWPPTRGTVATSTAAGVNVAVWDALRYLAARVEALEASADPVRLEAAELPVAPPDLGRCAGLVDALLGRPDAHHAVVVGECGEGQLLEKLRGAGRAVEGVEPRAASVWGRVRVGGAPPVTVVMAEVLDHLRTVPPDARAGVLLAGCVDRLGLADKVSLLDESVRVTRSGRTVVVLATDQSAWDDALDPPTRDLASGRPLHPETWSLLFTRSGLVDVTVAGPVPGVLRAVVGTVP